ncbi:MAG: hypothetical protein JWQ94_4554, partial [Tardiphaga sp.]|nr:hypothetical protein [Tardiphaga sp.]
MAGTGAGNTVSVCVTNPTITWGLYGSPTGVNPAIDANANVPMTA